MYNWKHEYRSAPPKDKWIQSVPVQPSIPHGINRIPRIPSSAGMCRGFKLIRPAHVRQSHMSGAVGRTLGNKWDMSVDGLPPYHTSPSQNIYPANVCKLYRLEPTIGSLTRQTCNMICDRVDVMASGWTPYQQPVQIADEYCLFILWALAAIYRISVEPTKPTQAGDTRSLYVRHRRSDPISCLAVSFLPVLPYSLVFCLTINSDVDHLQRKYRNKDYERLLLRLNMIQTKPG
ncbi:hypothetical protein BKA82DRAFT_4013065 [Pisolithus tinctorius]|nr:hypothetical protein BKA82DRAFT_4013065 [Pisolithus tinctorius]